MFKDDLCLQWVHGYRGGAETSFLCSFSVLPFSKIFYTCLFSLFLIYYLNAGREVEILLGQGVEVVGAATPEDPVIVMTWQESVYNLNRVMKDKAIRSRERGKELNYGIKDKHVCLSYQQGVDAATTPDDNDDDENERKKTIILRRWVMYLLWRPFLEGFEVHGLPIRVLAIKEYT